LFEGDSTFLVDFDEYLAMFLGHERLNRHGPGFGRGRGLRLATFLS
jgi:hypothetical protein